MVYNYGWSLILQRIEPKQAMCQFVHSSITNILTMCSMYGMPHVCSSSALQLDLSWSVTRGIFPNFRKGFFLFSAHKIYLWNWHWMCCARIKGVINWTNQRHNPQWVQTDPKDFVSVPTKDLFPLQPMGSLILNTK